MRRARRRKQVHLRHSGKPNRAATRRGMTRELRVGPYLVMVAKGRKPTARERIAARYMAWACRDEWPGLLERGETALLNLMLYGMATI